MCKAKDVHYVNTMMPVGLALTYRSTARLFQLRVIYSMACAHKGLDNCRHLDIIVFTAYVGIGAEQTIVPAASRYAEPASGRRHTRKLPPKRVLRPGRSAASQVRDASAGRYRKHASQSGRQSIRLLAAFFLSGTGSLWRSWTRRPAAAETRAAIRAQTDAGTDGFRCATPCGRSGHLQFPSGQTNRRALWRLGSPAQHRSPGAAPKKTTLSASDSVVGSDRRLVAAYEELRSQAVERFQQGPGMAILMTRGFRCWMEACGQLLGSPSETGPRKCLESCSPVGFRGEVVVLLASILLHRASKGMVCERTHIRK